MRQRWQFAVKFAVVMTLGTMLGAVFPWILEHLAAGTGGGTAREPLVGLMGAAAAITGTAFFASTMSRGMLQSFTVALFFPILLVVAVLLSLERVGAGTNAISWGGALFPSLAWPAMGTAYFWLAFRNYTSLPTGWRLWTRNFTRLAAVLASVMVVAGGIYARAWEYVLPLEPGHGPVRLSGVGRAVIGVARQERSVYALLPDGRLWAGQANQTWKLLSGHFADGSNWVDLSCNYSQGAVALKSDGTAWKLSRRTDPRQIGTDSDWKKLAVGQALFLGLKQDGTIWEWGNVTEQMPAKPAAGKKGATVRITNSTPVQIGQASDWADVLAPGINDLLALKRDGSLWKWRDLGGFGLRGTNNRISDQFFIRLNMPETNWLSVAGDTDNLWTMGVRNDGTLWSGVFGGPGIPVWNGKARSAAGPLRVGRANEPVRFGNKTDWVSVAPGVVRFVALEANGTFSAINIFPLETENPSRYHDWLAAAEDNRRTWALAKDGTISCWGDVFKKFPNEDDNPHWFHLRPSRRPLASINILDAK